MTKYFKPLFSTFFAIFLLTQAGSGADILVQFDPSQTTVTPDPAYHDGESAIFNAVTNDPRVQVTLAGRDYLQDPLDGEIWGLLDNSKWWNEGTYGWLVRQGWESSVIGVPTNHHADGDVAAAYLELIVTKSEDVVFDSITVSIEHPKDTEFINLWGSTSADGFASYVEGVVERTLNNEHAIVTFSGLQYSGSAPLELRIYGVLGEDDGTFGVKLALNTVPEPSAALLGLLALTGLSWRRRRRPRH